MLNDKLSIRYLRPPRSRSIAFLLASLLPLAGAMAAENGVSVYPAGVETIMPGMVPPPGQTILLNFDNFYQANGLMDGNGHSMVPGFHLRVAAVAVKVVHNWGVKALGGTLFSSLALPVLYEHLDGPFGNLHKVGLSNPDIGVLAVAYGRRSWHWWYGMDAYAPGAQYNKNDILNIGQHYFAMAPESAVTWLPQAGQAEISSKVQYIVNFRDMASGYESGREFVWEYAAMRNLTPKLSLGVNGYDYQQTSDDFENGIRVAGGNRGQAFAAGPQIRYHIGKTALIFKYQKEMAVRNRTRGNALWLQIGVPLWRAER